MKKLVSVLFSAACALPVASQSPIMGWSSWNTYHVNISDSLIIRQAEAMVSSGLKEAGYSYINIDDGFFGYRDSTGLMHPHPERFPNGLRRVSDYIHSLGFKAGIYSDAGGNTCGSRYDNDENGFGSGLYGHEKTDAALYFKEWNFDFIKIDYCGAGTELNLCEKCRYTEIRDAFDAVGCGNVAINICRWAFPGTWAADIAGSWRISPDIRPRWSSVRDIISKNLYLSAYCSPGHYNDMDMLEISRGMSQTEEETHFAMWCIMSSPLLIGCDMTKIKPSSLALLKNNELIALNQDTLGLQAKVVLHDGEGYVLVKDIGKRRGLTRAVALYNPSDTVLHFSLPVSVIEFEGKVKLRNIIRRKNMRAVRDSIVCDVPAHGVVMLRVEGNRRLEPSLYEAEWAFLPCFDALGKRKKLISYVENDAASGRMVVQYLGGRPENVIRWNDVWSDEGGEYDMTITYIPAERRTLDVAVNGHTVNVSDIKSSGETETVTFSITLRPGNNIVEMGSPYGWAPDIDKFELVKRR